MIEVECMSCKSCGGNLIHQDDNVWFCPYCNKFSIVNIFNQTLLQGINPSIGQLNVGIPFLLKISKNGVEKKIESIGSCTILFEYKRRATAADEYPANLSIQTSTGKFLLFKDVPRFKYSNIQVIPRDTDAMVNLFIKKDIVDSMSCRYGKEFIVNDISLQVMHP